MTSSQRNLVLIGTCLGVGVCAMVFSAINTALAVIKQDLSVSMVQTQWIMNIFGIAVSSSLVILGRLADIYGRKKLYLIGIFMAAISVLGSGLAPTAGWIIFFQALLGLAAGILIPVSQALISNVFNEDERGKAIGIWAAVVGLFMAIGPLFTGIVIAAFGWRWVFLINVPLVLISLVLVAIYASESRNEKQAAQLDWQGAILLTLTVGCFVVAVVQGNNWKPSLITVLYIISAIALITLLYFEKKTKTVPIIREDLFTSRTFLTAAIGNFCLIFFVWTCFFLIPLYLQIVHHYPVLKTGLMMLFVNIPLTVLSFTVGQWYKKIGPKLLINMGFIFLLVSAFIQMQFVEDTQFIMLMLGTLCFGIGWGLIWGPSTTAAISTLSQQEAGIASGTFVTIQEIGGAVGLAVTASVVRAHQDLVVGYHDGMWVLVLMCAIGLVATLMMKKTP